jgi:hypothetical protein
LNNPTSKTPYRNIYCSLWARPRTGYETKWTIDTWAPDPDNTCSLSYGACGSYRNPLIRAGADVRLLMEMMAVVQLWHGTGRILAGTLQGRDPHSKQLPTWNNEVPSLKGSMEMVQQMFPFACWRIPPSQLSKQIPLHSHD